MKHGIIHILNRDIYIIFVERIRIMQDSLYKCEVHKMNSPVN